MTITAMTMLDRYPGAAVLDKQLLTRCIETCLECGQACTACADADLGEQMVADLVKCARLNLDCADMCQRTARVLTPADRVRSGPDQSSRAGMRAGMRGVRRRV